MIVDRRGEVSSEKNASKTWAEVIFREYYLKVIGLFRDDRISLASTPTIRVSGESKWRRKRMSKAAFQLWLKFRFDYMGFVQNFQTPIKKTGLGISPRAESFSM